MRLQRLRHGMLSARSFQNMCNRTCLRYVAEVHTAWALEVLSAQPCQIFSLCSVEPGHAQYIHVYTYTSAVHTSSTAQGGGGSFKNRKPIGDVGCCESRMAERIH